MSIQPKGSPAFRKKFLMQLPPLMKDLNEGMKLIGWPEPAQKEFFGKLLPAHAESLKGQPLTELDHNMLVKQLEAIFAHAGAGERELRAAPSRCPRSLPRSSSAASRPKRRKQVGLVDESAVDWSGDGRHRPSSVDLDLGDDAAAGAGVAVGRSPSSTRRRSTSSGRRPRSRASRPSRRAGRS